MPHVPIANELPGISGLLTTYRQSGRPLEVLAQTLLRDQSPLTPFEREIIASFVSSRNNCIFCTKSHTAAACSLDKEQAEVVRQVLEDYQTAPISEKLRALLTIAGKVQQDGKLVTEEDVQNARNLGAEDRDIHDTVLIAAAFCMFNRYVDGLHTVQPTEDAAYLAGGERLATVGYIRKDV